jgi:hypothetical protein
MNTPLSPHARPEETTSRQVGEADPGFGQQIEKISPMFRIEAHDGRDAQGEAPHPDLVAGTDAE